MLCPMIRHFEDTEDNGPAIVPIDCLKEECTWWIPAFKCCSVKEIAIRCGQAADHLFQIHDSESNELIPALDKIAASLESIAQGLRK